MLLFAGVVLDGLELASLARAVDDHIHIGRHGTFGFFEVDGEDGLGHFISPLNYEVLYLVSLKRIYEVFKKMSSIILNIF